jgi:hypothetical protein
MFALDTTSPGLEASRREVIQIRSACGGPAT